MAKGDVTLKFDAQTAQFVQAVTAARAKLEEGADSARKFGDATAKAGDKAEGGMGKLTESVKNAAMQFASLAAAAEIAKSTIDTFYRRQEEKAGTLLKNVQSIDSAMAAAGQSAFAPQVRGAIEVAGGTKIGGKLVNPEEATQIAAAVYTVQGAKMTPQGALDATKYGLQGRAMGLDLPQAQQLAVKYAQLERFGLADMTRELAVGHPAELSERELSFVAGAQDKRQAATLLISAAQGEQPARGLAALFTASEESIDPVKVKELQTLKSKHPGKFPAEDERILRLSEIPAGGQRLEAMLRDETLAPAADRLAIRRLREGAANVRPLPAFEDEIAQSRAAMDPAARAKEQFEAVETTRAMNRSRGGVPAVTLKNRIDYAAEVWQEDHPILANSWSTAIMSRLVGGLHQLLDKPPVTAPTTQPTSDLHLQELKKQTEHLENMAAQAAQQTSTLRTRRDTTLSNNSEGQK